MALYVKFDCATCENEYCTGHGLPTTEKVCDGYKHTTTNADRIRSMTDEELADELLEWFACFTAVEWSRDMILDYLKKEADGGGV